MALEWPGYVLSIGNPQNRPEDVGEVQKKLGVWVTQVYGETTAQCVANYQASHQIQKNGMVGQQTWNSLFHIEPAPPPSTLIGPDALSWAKGEQLSGPNTYGVMEDPPSSNCGDRVEEYQAAGGQPPGVAWCMCFCMWCLKKAASGKGVKMPIPTSGSCSYVYNWARDNGKLVYAPQPGDLFLVIGGETGHFHTGFVATSPDNSNKYQTIEGNSNLDGSANGIAVVWRSPGRPVSSCDYVRV